MMSGRGSHYTGSKSVHIYNCPDMSFLTLFEKKSLKKVKKSLDSPVKPGNDRFFYWKLLTRRSM